MAKSNTHESALDLTWSAPRSVSLIPVLTATASPEYVSLMAAVTKRFEAWLDAVERSSAGNSHASMNRYQKAYDLVCAAPMSASLESLKPVFGGGKRELPSRIGDALALIRRKRNLPN